MHTFFYPQEKRFSSQTVISRASTNSLMCDGNARRKSGAFPAERGTRESSVIACDLSIRNENSAALICIYKIPTELDALPAFILCDFRTFRRNLVKANSSRSLASPYCPLGTASLDASRARWNPFRRCNIPGQVYSF